MRTAKKIILLLFALVLLGLSICQTTLFTVDTSNFLLQKTGHTLLNGEKPADRWKVVNKMTGKTEEILFTDTNRMVWREENYNYLLSGNPFTGSVTVNRADGSLYMSGEFSAEGNGMWWGSQGGMSFDPSEYNLLTLAIQVKTGSYFLRFSFLKNLRLFILLFSGGLILLLWPSRKKTSCAVPQGRPSGITLEETLPIIGCLLIGAAILTFVLMW